MYLPWYVYVGAIIALIALILCFAYEDTAWHGYVPRSHRRTARARSRVLRYRTRGYGFMTGVLRWMRPIAFAALGFAAIIGYDYALVFIILKR